MFINASEELNKARKEGYAIGAFNTCNLEATKAICQAAQESGKPVIIQTTPKAIDYAGLDQIFNIVKTEIEDKDIKAAIHLDHAKDFEIVQKCIDIGYRSVMIDGSGLPFPENVAITKRVVDYARVKNVSVEGEIGVIGSEHSSPHEAEKFVELTGVDSLAISVGNEHGAPEGEKIDLKLLKEIAERVAIPLVLHGSSGLSDDDVREAIKLGVAKINIDTAIRRAFLEGLTGISSEVTNYREVLKGCIENVKQVVKDKIELLS